jgi:hypothetical protein
MIRDEGLPPKGEKPAGWVCQAVSSDAVAASISSVVLVIDRKAYNWDVIQWARALHSLKE